MKTKVALSTIDIRAQQIVILSLGILGFIMFSMLFFINDPESVFILLLFLIFMTFLALRKYRNHFNIYADDTYIYMVNLFEKKKKPLNTFSKITAINSIGSYMITFTDGDFYYFSVSILDGIRGSSSGDYTKIEKELTSKIDELINGDLQNPS